MADEITYRLANAADAAAVARVQVASWRESFRGLVDQAWLDSMSVEQRPPSYRQRLMEESECYRLRPELARTLRASTRRA